MTEGELRMINEEMVRHAIQCDALTAEYWELRKGEWKLRGTRNALMATVYCARRYYETRDLRDAAERSMASPAVVIVGDVPGLTDLPTITPEHGRWLDARAVTEETAQRIYDGKQTDDAPGASILFAQLMGDAEGTKVL